MKKKRTWSSMAKRTACILTALCVTAAAVPGTGGYNYSEVFAAEEADDLREGLSVYLNFEDALTTNSASQSAQKVEVQGSGVTRKESEGISGSAAYFDGTSASSLKLPDGVNAAWDDVTLMACQRCAEQEPGSRRQMGACGIYKQPYGEKSTVLYQWKTGRRKHVGR